MSKRATGHSPNFINAHRIRFSKDISDAVVDTIVQMLVEGYADGFSQRDCSAVKPVAGRKEAA